MTISLCLPMPSLQTVMLAGRAWRQSPSADTPNVKFTTAHAADTVETPLIPPQTLATLVAKETEWFNRLTAFVGGNAAPTGKQVKTRNLKCADKESAPE